MRLQRSHLILDEQYRRHRPYSPIPRRIDAAHMGRVYHLRDSQHDAELAALAGRAGDANRAAHRLHEIARDRETQPKAAGDAGA